MHLPVHNNFSSYSIEGINTNNVRCTLQVSDLRVDMLTLVGHKFGAPKGVAALFVRRGLELPPMVHGGGQEAGRRAGTENVLLISGMGKAAEVL